MQLTHKIRINPTPDQEVVLWHLSGQCRLIYNFALAERIEAWERNNLYSYLQVFPWSKPEWVGYVAQQNDLPRIKKKYPRYKSVYSKVLQMVLRTLDADFRSFFALRRNGDHDAMPPRYKGKKYFTTMTYNQSGFKAEKGSITLTHNFNDVPLTFTIPEKFEFAKIYQLFMKSPKNRMWIMDYIKQLTLE